MARGELLTVGHGTLEADELVALLQAAGVEVLMDVRSYPGSRRHPQFGKDTLAARLSEDGIAYWWDKRLGGRRTTVPDSPNRALRNDAFRGYADHMATRDFAEALDGLLPEVIDGSVAVMCAESLWWRCHRRLLADAVVLTRDIPVRHMLHGGRLVPHAVTEGARAADGKVVYDLGIDRPLPL
jgi:uncharacterized protein (DUF488 family)